MALIFACAAGLMEKSKMQIIPNHLGSLLQSQCQESSGLWWLRSSLLAPSPCTTVPLPAADPTSPLPRSPAAALPLRWHTCRPLRPAFRSPLPHAKHPQFLYSSLQSRAALDQTSQATYHLSTDPLNGHIFKQNPFLAVWIELRMKRALQEDSHLKSN